MTIFLTISQINQNSNFLYLSQLHSLRCLLFAVQNIWCVSSIYYRSESERKKVVVVVKRRLLSKLYVNCVKKEREFLMLACYLSAITEEVICGWVKRAQILLHSHSKNLAHSLLSFMMIICMFCCVYVFLKNM